MATTKTTTPKRRTTSTPASETSPDNALPTTDSDPACHTEHGYISDKARYLARLKRIEGQARGIHRMVEEEKYCIDILTQVSALTKALEGVALGLLDDHLRHCVMDAATQGGDVAEEKLKEASDAIARLVRS
jgi:DNA-binding FrmR family transcriptional regulator